MSSSAKDAKWLLKEKIVEMAEELFKNPGKTAFLTVKSGETQTQFGPSNNAVL